MMAKNLVRLCVIWACVFVLGGCIYKDVAMPEIVTAENPGANLIKPPVVTTISRRPDVRTSNMPRGWVPPSGVENKKRWQGIVLHHSATAYGSAAHEHEYHKSLGWDGLGYHFVINNGVFRNNTGRSDGLVEVGYRWRSQQKGSHCRVNGDGSNYYNRHTIGICLIGNFERTRPTERQWRSLVKLVRFLQKRYNIPTSEIKGHRDIKPTDCPGKNFVFWEFKRRLSG